MIRRRDFITLLGGAAAWPLAARAQQPERMRRIGMLIQYDETDSEGKLRLSAFTQALADLGWTDGRNVRIDLRSYYADTNRIQALAQELVGLQPDIIVTATTPPTVAVQRETRTIPIVSAGVTDPVAQRIVVRLDRPTGNITGFADLGEASLGGKWGLICSRRSCPGSSGPPSCLIPTLPPYRLLCLHLRWRPGHSRSR